MLLAIHKLTFDKAFELALLFKSPVQNAWLLWDMLSTKAMHFVDFTGSPKEPLLETSCFHCGRSHYVMDCHFKGVKCNYWHKKGRIRICRSHIQQQQSQSLKSLPAKPKWEVRRQTHKMERKVEPFPQNSTNAEPVTPQASLVEQIRRLIPIWCLFDLNGVMEIGTSSALHDPCQSSNLLKALASGKFSTSENTPIWLQIYSGDWRNWRWWGELWWRFGVEGRKWRNLFVVVGGGGKSLDLLDQDWLCRLRLDCRKVQVLNAMPDALEALLTKHSNLFRDELGIIKGIDYHCQTSYHSWSKTAFQLVALFPGCENEWPGTGNEAIQLSTFYTLCFLVKSEPSVYWRLSSSQSGQNL